MSSGESSFKQFFAKKVDEPYLMCTPCTYKKFPAEAFFTQNSIVIIYKKLAFMRIHEVKMADVGNFFHACDYHGFYVSRVSDDKEFMVDDIEDKKFVMAFMNIFFPSK
jgi:hypothetical protein